MNERIRVRKSCKLGCWVVTGGSVHPPHYKTWAEAFAEAQRLAWARITARLTGAMHEHLELAS